MTKCTNQRTMNNMSIFPHFIVLFVYFNKTMAFRNCLKTVFQERTLKNSLKQQRTYGQMMQMLLNSNRNF